MKRARWLAVTLLAAVLALAAGCAPPRVEAISIGITGASQADLSGAEVYYETAPGGRHIYVQQAGPGDDLRVIDIGVPANPQPGQYALTNVGETYAGYYEVVSGVSRQFTQNVSGTLTLDAVQPGLSGSFAFTASTPSGPGETITASGTFQDLPLVVIPGTEPTATVALAPTPTQAPPAGATAPTPGGAEAAAQAPRSPLPLYVALCMVGLLVVANFGFQFYVGSVVYALEGGTLLRSLRGTRTFIRGWADPDLRTVMIAWTLVLIGLAFFLVVLLVMGG
jgi:hypothetical protein